MATVQTGWVGGVIQLIAISLQERQILYLLAVKDGPACDEELGLIGHVLEKLENEVPRFDSNVVNRLGLENSFVRHEQFGRLRHNRKQMLQANLYRKGCSSVKVSY